MRRRRSYREKVKPPRRERPVVIECHGVTRDEPFCVHQGNQEYEFARDGAGRLVTSVAIEDHIACFLARPEMYRVIG